MIRTILLLVLICPGVAGLGQTRSLPLYHPQFKYYTTEDGLLTNTVFNIAQDARGFLWFGGSEGLSRFDSYSFKNYLSLDEPDGTTAQVTAISALGTDYLWVGSSGRVYVYDYSSARFVSAEALNDVALGVITSIAGRDHEAWIGSASAGIYRYNHLSGEVKHYAAPENISKLFRTGGDTLLALTFQGDLFQYQPAEDLFRRISPYDPRAYQMNIACGIFARNGDLWMGDWSQGIFCFNRETGQVTQYRITHEGRPIERIHAIIEYTDDQLMVGSDEGLTIVDKKSGSSRTITSNKLPGQTNALNNRFVYPLFKDRDNGIWIGTYFGGVNYLSPNKRYFQTREHPRLDTTDYGQVVSRLYEDHRGTIWIGTDDGGLQRFDRQTRLLHRVPIGGANEPLNVHALSGSGDTLWVGTYQRGVYRYHTRQGGVRHYPEIQSVYAIFLDRQHTLWAGSPDGLFRLDKQLDKFVRHEQASGVRGIEKLTEDDKGHIWFTSESHGLSTLNPGSGQLVNFDTLLQRAGILGKVSTIHVQQDDLWIGTNRKGLYHLDLASNTLTVAPVHSDILHTTAIQYITSSPGRQLWLTTGIGLFRYQTNDHTLQLFNRDDGLLSDQFNHGAGLHSRSGTIFVGGNQGFNFFEPHDIPSQSATPTVRITDFTVHSKKSGVVHPPLLETMQLNHTETVFTIAFSAMDYAKRGKSRFRYKLEGFDEDFVETVQNNVTYTNVPAGSYVFKVAAMSSFGVWHEDPTTIHIVVSPRWWLSPAMRVLYLIGFIGAAAFSVYFAVRQSRKKQRARLDKLKMENEQQIAESKMTFFTHIAHEIRTPATLIAAPIEGILQSGNLPQQFAEDLDIIRKNSNRLIGLINQVLDLRNVDHGHTRIYCEHTVISSFIEDGVSQFKPFCHSNGITLRYEVHQREALMGYIDRDIVHKIVANLLSNAVKFAKDLITVRLSPSDTGFTLLVEDNGPGIAEEDLSRIFDPFFTKAAPDSRSLKGFGVGLSLVAKLVAVIGAKISVTNLDGGGTRFGLEIPYGEPNESAAALFVRDAKRVETDDNRSGYPMPPAFVPDAPRDDRHTILMVEDHVELSAYLGKFVQADYNVLLASNGVEALRILEAQPVDLIITDIAMPEMDGITLCEYIRRDFRISHLPIIMLTADTNVQSKIDGIGNGADAYLEKPISLGLLAAQIGTILRKRDYLRKMLSQPDPGRLSSIATHDRDREFLDRIEAIILDNLSNPDFSVDHIAKHLAISRSGLYAKLSSLSETPPNELIRVVRLRKAAEYLEMGEYRVNEICYLVGFNSPSYFTRCFVKQYGKTPKEYQGV